MCGINGIALSSKNDGLVDEARLARMRDIMTHRGPDDAGLFISGRIGLGHRRLSIVDVKTGQQPMANEDGSLHIVFNGEIYNHAEYREPLERAGHRYRTRSDTETILHLYEEEGESLVGKLRGMFAFAIWDENRKRLFLARDRLGVKPLYYVHAPDGSLFFASEMKALFAAGAARPEVYAAALPDYLANHATSGEETLFVGVKRLLPGHTLVWQDGRVEIARYWDVSFEKETPPPPERSAVEKFRELFRTSVRLRLMSDVPLGLFLSGGIDSSAIAAMMSGMVEEPIKTFSVAFAERGANELEYARLVARAFGTDHHEVLVSGDDFFGALPRMIWHEDEPIAHAASIPLYFVSKLAAQHVKVVLTGEGSDESLAGYSRYRKTVYLLAFGRLYEKAAPAALRRLLRAGVGALPPFARNKLSRTFLSRRADIENLYFDNFAVFSREMQAQLLDEGVRSRLPNLDPYVTIRGYTRSDPHATLLDRLLYADIKTYLHELLMKQDQMSMAASIESRVPFLDHKLIEFTASLPDRMKLRGWTTKHILREAMRGLLPDTILTRPKMGFPVPLRAWFRGPYRPLLRDALLGERAAGRGFFNRAFIESILAAHEAGQADHSERLWALLNFELWQRAFFDGEAAGGPAPGVMTTTGERGVACI